MSDILNTSEKESVSVAMLVDWQTNFSETGKMGEPELSVVREGLKTLGAKVEGLPLEAITRLQQYTNVDRGSAIRAVWGKDFYTDYRKWTKFMAQWYEGAQGIMLPSLPESGVKSSGMTAWLGDLTSYAVGSWSFEKYKKISEARREVGRIVRDGERGVTKRPRVYIPGKDDHVPSGYQPDFPAKAIREILSLKKAA